MSNNSATFCLSFDCANALCAYHHSRESVERPRSDTGYPLPVKWDELRDTNVCAGFTNTVIDDNQMELV